MINNIVLDTIKKDLRNNGFVLLKNFIKNNSEFIGLKNKFYDLICFKAKQYRIAPPSNTQDSINNIIIQLYKIDKSFGSYLNDISNNFPELYKVFCSSEIIELSQNILGDGTGFVLINNVRFRSQIPSRDNVSNLPWHQDSHYNEIKVGKSIAIWISVFDVNQEQGPVVFKSGSHESGEIPMVTYKKSNGGEVFAVDQSYIDDTRYEETSFLTNSGDVVLIDMNVIHRSGYNTSENLIKLSIQARLHILFN